MSIASEIKSVLQEVGSSITVRKWDGTLVTGEFIDDTSHTEKEKPIAQSFFFNLSLHHPTAIEVGDTVIWGTSPHIMEILVTAIAPQFFAREIVEYIASGFVVNAKGAFYSFNQETDDATSDYDEVPKWLPVYPSIETHATMIDSTLKDMLQAIGGQSMDVALDRPVLFVSSKFSNIAMGMQWRSTTGSMYKVNTVGDNSYIGIRAVFLSEETRP